jgi:hypothetical protein
MPILTELVLIERVRRAKWSITALAANSAVHHSSMESEAVSLNTLGSCLFHRAQA